MDKNSAAQVRMRIESLRRQRELLEKKKLAVFEAVGELKRHLKDKKISQSSYDAELKRLSPRELIKDCNERIEEIDNEIKEDSSYVENIEKRIGVKKEKDKAPAILITLIVFAMLSLSLFFSGTLTGFIFKEQLTTQTEHLDLSITEKSAYTIIIPPGELRSLAVSGKLLGKGTAKIYFEKNGERYLIANATTLKESALTPFTVEDIVREVEGQKDIIPVVPAEKEPEVEVKESPENATLVVELHENLTEQIAKKIAEPTAEELAILQKIAEPRVSTSTGQIVTEELAETPIEALEKITGEHILISIAPVNESEAAEGLEPISEIEPVISINLSYQGDSIFDVDNDGVESIKSAVDFTVEHSTFNWNVDAAKLCTRWETYSVENEESTAVCHGAKQCCGLVELAPELDEWNATFYSYYERYGATYNNTINAQVLYVDIKGGAKSLVSNIYYSEWDSLSANFVEAYEKPAAEAGIVENITLGYFNNLCIDTCSISINETNYTIIFEVENATLVIDNLSYSFAEIVEVVENLSFEDEKDDYEIDEDLVFNVSVPSKEKKVDRDFIRRASGFRKGLNEVELTTGILKAEAFVRENNGPDEELIKADVEISEVGNDKFEFKLAKKRAIHAGRYTLKAEFVDKKTGEITYYEKNFTWGVLAINTNKATYEVFDDAFIGMAVLDDGGAMVCNASVTLEIISPSGTKDVLSTENGLITVSPTCTIYNITELPDYYSNYAVVEEGEYVMNLTALTYNGERTLIDKFYSERKPEFDVERDGPTRTYPPADYTMSFTIKANRPYRGEITERIPASFSLIEQEPDYIVAEDENEKILIWNVNLGKDEEMILDYKFNTPPLSPYLFILGPLKIGSFEEKRSWMIASDKKYTYTDLQLTPNSTTVNEGTNVRVQTTYNVNTANGNSAGTIVLKLKATSGSDSFAIGTACGGSMPFRYLSSAFRNCSTATLTCSDDGSGNITAADTSASNTNEQFEVNWTIQSCPNSGGKTYTIADIRTDASTAAATLDNTATITVNNGVIANITLKSPLNGTFNNSAVINFTFKATTDDDFGGCRIWHNYTSWGINNTNTTAILNNTLHGINASFDNDYHIEWNVECNDSVGAANFSYVNFTLYIDTTKPIVNLTGPENATTFAVGAGLTFNFTFVENANETCELWGNFTGTWLMNQTLHRNVTPTDSSGAIVKNIFATRINLGTEFNPDGFGEYIWNVRCNDSAGNKQFNYTWPEKNNSNFTFFVAGAANNKPLIENVTILPEGYVDPGRTVTPIENSTIRVVVQFNVTDADGTGDLSATTARANLSYRSIARYNDTGNCFTRVISTNVLEVNCTISLYYYDNASANWGVNVSIADAAGETAQNQSNGNWLQMPNVTVNTLSAVQIMQNAVTFGSVTTGDQNKEASFVINNTGNDAFTWINVTAYDLNNSDSTSFFRIQGNFSVNATQNAGGAGRALINRTQVPVPIGSGAANENASLPIRDPNGDQTTGIQTIYIYADIPINLLETSTIYNSTPPGWAINMTN